MAWLCEDIECRNVELYDTPLMLDAPSNVLQLCARQDNKIGLKWAIHCSNKGFVCDDTKREIAIQCPRRAIQFYSQNRSLASCIFIASRHSKDEKEAATNIV
jgi:hypothetical protein